MCTQALAPASTHAHAIPLPAQIVLPNVPVTGLRLERHGRMVGAEELSTRLLEKADGLRGPPPYGRTPTPASRPAGRAQGAPKPSPGGAARTGRM